MSSSERVLFVLLIVTYLIVGALFAIRTPDWQAPDEPAHYNYVAQVTTNGCCPVLELGDWNSVYLDNLKGVHFRPDTLGDLGTIQYEDHQPPLYYLLESIIFRLTNGSLTALRLFSVLLGAGVVAGAYAVGKALLPNYPQIALGAAAFVAFLPQHIAMLAAVENDALAELIVAITLWGIVVYLKSGRVKAWQLGVLVGLGLLTKISTIFLAGLVPLAILIKWWLQRDTGRRSIPSLLQQAALFGLPALILAGIWWLRDLSVYGSPDIFGLGRHNQVVVGQLRTADYIAQLGVGEYLRRGLETTFDSFWGQFGWMALPLSNGIYAVILIFLGITALGWIIGLARPLEKPLSPPAGSQEDSLSNEETPPRKDTVFLPSLRSGEGAGVRSVFLPSQRAAWFILTLTAILALLQYLYYNSEFVQFQGRYMYPGLIPLGLWIALGLDGWRRLFFADRRGLVLWIAPAVIALLIPLDLYLVWRVIPSLAP
ncbi:MAG: glycosyltransferase family 39 protein [Chloroflexota bacterium]